MIKKSLTEIAAYVSGEVNEKCQDVRIHGVCIDSRGISEGNLFIPLKGGQLDGHQYVIQAIENGAAAALWEKQVKDPPKNVPLVIVDDALAALQAMAKKYIATLPAVVIGITGSNGKTTTKDLLAAVLEQTFSVHKTQGNYNNHIGLPLTILTAPPDCEVLILEMGMNHRGEIAFLSKLANPHLAVITNVGDAHLRDLGSKEGIAAAKCEIIEGMQEDGVLFYYGDEPLLQDRLKPILRKQSFGRASSNDFYPDQMEVGVEGTTFSVSEQPFFLPVSGEHNVINALAAIAVAYEFNMSWHEIATGLRQVKLTNMRTELVYGAKGEVILNDAYNANPTAMKAAIKLVHDCAGFQRKIVVLADMFELGKDEEMYHQMIGMMLDPHEVTQVYTFGPLSQHTAAGALQNFPKERVSHFLDKVALVRALQTELQPNDLILFKGSRGMRLEEVIGQLL